MIARRPSWRTLVPKNRKHFQMIGELSLQGPDKPGLVDPERSIGYIV